MKILYVEGLFSRYFLRYLQRGMIPPTRGNHEIEIRSHKDKSPTNADVIIGHSLGAEAAILIAAVSNKNFDLVVTLDPRVRERPYKKSDNVLELINFYRDHWWMRGYKVDGATNIEMPPGIGHGKLASDAGIIRIVKKSIRRLGHKRR